MDKHMVDGKYRGWWPVLDEMPGGWVEDKTAGSPLGGCIFITNGKSPLHGQERALLRIKREQPKDDA